MSHKALEDLKEENFLKELASLINRYSYEQRFGNAPDFMLATYALRCLELYWNTVHGNDVWHNRVPPSVPLVECRLKNEEP